MKDDALENLQGRDSIRPGGRRLPGGLEVVPALRGSEPCRIDGCGRLPAELEGGGGS